MTGDNAFFAFTSKRAGDRKWKVTAFNDDNTNPHKLKVFAVLRQAPARLG